MIINRIIVHQDLYDEFVENSPNVSNSFHTATKPIQKP